MPSTCPKCRQIVSEDIICCADLEYTWKCRSCHKVSTGFAIPYGKCFMCGGELQIAAERSFEDPMRVRPIREAVQFELNTYHFYRLALQRAKDPILRAVFEQLYQNEVDHLHLLQERYHTHLSDDVLDLRPGDDKLLADVLFRGLNVADPEEEPVALYDKAIEIERRNRDHFRRLSAELQDGPEKDVCLELAAEEDEHAALLETEREQFLVARKG